MVGSGGNIDGASLTTPGRDEALKTLDDGDAKGLSKNLKLEGSTHADCLIECERAFVWIEGKRNDWLSPSIKWDVTRDQLARNLDAVWQLAGQARKDFWLLICHEHDLSITNRNSLTVTEPEHGRLVFHICQRTQDCYFDKRLAPSGGRLFFSTGLLSSWSDGKRSPQDVRCWYRRLPWRLGQLQS